MGARGFIVQILNQLDEQWYDVNKYSSLEQAKNRIKNIRGGRARIVETTRTVKPGEKSSVRP